MNKQLIDSCRPKSKSKIGKNGRILLYRVHNVCGYGQAQQAGKIFRIGFLDTSTASGSAVLLEAFRQELSKLGWIEGKNITIEYRFAEQKHERLPELAAELVRLKVDLIMISGGPTPLAAKRATTTIPIVMTNTGDPVGAGLVASLARPGGNVTGTSGLSPELNTKRLEILKDAIPKLVRVGLLRQPGGVLADLQLERAQACGSGTEAEIGGDRDSTRRQRFRERLSNRKAEAGGRDYDDHRSHAFSPKESGSSSLPSNTGCRLFTPRRSLSMRAASCPMGRTSTDLFRRAAVYVDKILKGAKPADLPVQQATKFEFVINLKAAKQIGLTISPEFLARANQVIK